MDIDIDIDMDIDMLTILSTPLVFQGRKQIRNQPVIDIFGK